MAESGLNAGIIDGAACDFRAYNPARQAGMMIEPSDSVPRDRGANPAATPAALPDEEPAGPYKALIRGKRSGTYI
jgi:hypothetical protein